MLYRYKLHTRDGADAGEAEYAVWIKPGELIYANDGGKSASSMSCRCSRRRPGTWGC